MNKINVVSLFDGLGGARQALKNLEIDCNYFASEIDEYAIKISKKNHSDIKHLGSVEKITISKLKKLGVDTVDLLIGGSPCQDLSLCKANRQGLKGERSKLFYQYVRLLKELKPKYFLLENVSSMRKSDAQIITDILCVEPIMINSALLTAQNRRRYYWTNIPNVKQPKDKKIFLKDILEKGFTDKDKSYCIDASYYKGGNLKSYFGKGRRQLVFNKPIQLAFIKKNQQGNRVYSVEGKSVSLKAEGGGGGAKTGLYTLPHALTECRTEEAKEIRRKMKKKTGKDYCPRRGKTIQPRKDGKSNCLTTGITKEYYLNDGIEIRKLTPIECERLQGLPDNYTKGVSNTQRYKMIGNGFTIPVVSHILKNMEI